MKKKQEEYQMDEFHYHEVLDRSYIIGNMIGDLLTEHPAIVRHENLKKKVDMAEQLLRDTYQEIGALRMAQFTSQSEEEPKSKLDKKTMFDMSSFLTEVKKLFIPEHKATKCDHKKNFRSHKYTSLDGTPMIKFDCYDCGYKDHSHVYGDTENWNNLTIVENGLVTTSCSVKKL